MLKRKVTKVLRKCRENLENSDNTRPLIENINDLQDGNENEGSVAQTILNTAGDGGPRELLDVPSDGYCQDSDSKPIHKNVHQPEHSEPQSFPEPPEDLDKNLEQHLTIAKQIVSNELRRFCSLKQPKSQIDSWHRQTFAHLTENLLQNISTSKSCFMLEKWVVHTYLSQGLLGDPDHHLLKAWEETVKQKLTEYVKRDVSESLHKILQTHRSQTCYDEETYVGLYVDIIQCMHAMSSAAQETSSELYDQVQEVCFQELLNFVKSYTKEQTEVLGEKVNIWMERKDNMETILFYKTLKTCKELRHYVQTEGRDISPSLHKETVTTLENMEALILKLQLEMVTDLTKLHLKDYFKSSNIQLPLFTALKTHFPKLSYVMDEQKIVMEEVYKVIDQIYFKHLIRTRRSKLKRWTSDVGPAVSADVQELLSTISHLAPGVQCQNLMLKSIPDVLESKFIDSIKLILARMQEDCEIESEDLKLLLQWKGLSKQEIREVLEALPGHQPEDGSGSWFLRLNCCCC